MWETPIEPILVQFWNIDKCFANPSILEEPCLVSHLENFKKALQPIVKKLSACWKIYQFRYTDRHPYKFLACVDIVVNGLENGEGRPDVNSTIWYRIWMGMHCTKFKCALQRVGPGSAADPQLEFEWHKHATSTTRKHRSPIHSFGLLAFFR